MTNIESVNAICEQISTEAGALQKTMLNAATASSGSALDILEEIKISCVVHLQNLVMALTKEMTPSEKEEFQEQVNETAEPEEEG